MSDVYSTLSGPKLHNDLFSLFFVWLGITWPLIALIFCLIDFKQWNENFNVPSQKLWNQLKTILITAFDQYWKLIASIFAYTNVFALGPSMYYVGITLCFFWPSHYVSINTVINISKTCHFLNPPTQLFCWHNIWMVHLSTKLIVY